MRHPFNSNTDLKKLDKLKIEDRFIYFYKIIPTAHTQTILSKGLDSKFGGEYLRGKEKNDDSAIKHSAGRIFLADNLKRVEAFRSTIGETDEEKKNNTILEIKIPIHQTMKLNLVWEFSNGEWWVAGTKISPKYIKVLPSSSP